MFSVLTFVLAFVPRRLTTSPTGVRSRARTRRGRCIRMAAFQLRGARERIVGPGPGGAESDDAPCCTAHKSAPYALGCAPVFTTARNIARQRPALARPPPPPAGLAARVPARLRAPACAMHTRCAPVPARTAGRRPAWGWSCCCGRWQRADTAAPPCCSGTRTQTWLPRRPRRASDPRPGRLPHPTPRMDRCLQRGGGLRRHAARAPSPRCCSPRQAPELTGELWQMHFARQPAAHFWCKYSFAERQVCRSVPSSPSVYRGPFVRCTSRLFLPPWPSLLPSLSLSFRTSSTPALGACLHASIHTLTSAESVDRSCVCVCLVCVCVCVAPCVCWLMPVSAQARSVYQPGPELEVLGVSECVFLRVSKCVCLSVSV